MGIFERWKRGETVQVQSKYSGKIFTIRPERWAGITLGYTILVDGQPVPEHYRKKVDDADFRRWCADLIEVKEEPSDMLPSDETPLPHIEPYGIFGTICQHKPGDLISDELGNCYRVTEPSTYCAEIHRYNTPAELVKRAYAGE